MATALTSDQRLVRRILRVNHAGEHGAISIYSAQLKRKGAYPADIEAWLAEALDHERAHRAAFQEAMQPRSAKPCRALGVWSVGGWLLGSITAMLGRTGVVACTAAVERTVHGHLEDQIAFLRRCDADLAALVEHIQVEELSHLAYAEANLKPGSLLARPLSVVIACATEILIAASTRGDSIRLRCRLRARS
ncbi:MAG: demethoxyubiquinone hydroxylase family protein [Brevundimonas sp.]|uniref:demethoxyubiquinone hydroxylase family protein n=1 Tax=Brevundimonas sp. TaxID=1871086 RepID=UPI00391A891A